MLVFVTPLMSSQVAQNWERVKQLFIRTIRSACAQTCPDFRVLVVCHEIPDIEFQHPAIDFLPVSFPPPGADRLRRISDQNRKIFVGLQRSLTFRPSHVMILDADDCVSKRVAAHVAAHSSSNGWYINKGYFHMEGCPEIHWERHRFHKWCGSSHVLRPEFMDLPDQYFEGWRYRHTQAAIKMRKRGTPIQPLPFPGAVYNVSHSENLNDYAPILWPKNPFLRFARRVLFYRRLTPRIRDEFGLYPLSG